MYSCAGNHLKSTKETAKDWNTLINGILNILSQGQIQPRNIQMSLCYEEIFSNENSQLKSFLENCRNAQLKGELDDKFLYLYRFLFIL